MSMWQFMAALDGYVAANTPESERGLTTKENADIWEWMQGM